MDSYAQRYVGKDPADQSTSTTNSRRGNYTDEFLWLAETQCEVRQVALGHRMTST